MKKEMEKFLIYSYFGILSDNNEEIKSKCIRKAYLDLSRTIKYKYSADKSKEINQNHINEEDYNNFIKDKNDFINSKEKIIKKEIEKLLSNNIGKSSFDKWHNELCKNLENTNNDEFVFKDNGSLTYGQAQKWVNMSLKYLYLFGFLENFKDCLHVPIDSYIIDSVQELDENILKDSIGKEKWSNIDDKDAYIKLQKDLRKKIEENENKSPIEWEGTAWIAIANNKSK